MQYVEDPITCLKKGKIEYKNYRFSFDIETYKGYMYIWQASFLDYIIIGRTWEQFNKFIAHVEKLTKCNKNKPLLCLVHNLLYEFQFIKHHLTYTAKNAVFCKSGKRNILFAKHKEGIRFIDTLSLTGCALDGLPERYGLHTKKLKGALDYTIPRNMLTPITGMDLAYCINDVKILAEYSDYLYEEIITKFGKVPTTKTSILQYKIYNRIEKFCNDNGFTINKWHLYIKSHMPSETLYKRMHLYAYSGGFVHGNFYKIGEKIKDVMSKDITSSYPFTMLLRFPCGTWELQNNKHFSTVEEVLASKQHVLARYTFTNLRAKFGITTESTSKAVNFEESKTVVDNGRLLHCYGKYVVFCYEPRLKVIEMFYEWDSVTIDTIYINNRSEYLPKCVISQMLDDYQAKARLKEQGKPYKLEKESVNSSYGLFCKRLYFETDIWNPEACDFTDTKVKDYDSLIGNLLFLPYWGHYISDYARLRLCKAVYETRKDFIYSDTDSIKFTNHERYADYFAKVNKQTQAYTKKRLAELGYDFEPFADLGTFDDEGIGTFKTLGAKRYIFCVNGNITCTIAGLPKNDLPLYTFQNVGATNQDIFDTFEDKLAIDLTNKMRAVYHDEPRAEYITDYLGNTCEMREASSIELLNNTFTLKMNETWLQVLFNIKGGYF